MEEASGTLMADAEVLHEKGADQLVQFQTRALAALECVCVDFVFENMCLHGQIYENQSCVVPGLHKIGEKKHKLQQMYIVFPCFVS